MTGFRVVCGDCDYSDEFWEVFDFPSGESMTPEEQARDARAGHQRATAHGHVEDDETAVQAHEAEVIQIGEEDSG